jgi:hypothetical protein
VLPSALVLGQRILRSGARACQPASNEEYSIA